MDIVMSHQVRDEIKETLLKSGKTAARFVLKEYGYCGALFNVEMSDPREGDFITEVNDITFVVDSKFVFALKYPEIEKVGDQFCVKRTVCGG